MSRNRRRDRSTITNRDVARDYNLPRSVTYQPTAGWSDFNVELPRPRPRLVRGEDLRKFEDRRHFHPQRRTRPAVSFDRYARRLRALTFTPAVQAFMHPQRVAICVRRSVRKEVMFAKRYAGRRGQRRPRFNWFSRISCRR